MCASLNEGGLSPSSGLIHSDPALILISCSPLSRTIFRVTISAATWRADRYLIPFSEPNSIELTGRGFVAILTGTHKIRRRLALDQNATVLSCAASSNAPRRNFLPVRHERHFHVV